MKIKEPVLLILTFVLLVPIGTISHEFGHIIIAKNLGYETNLHYGSMSYDFEERKNELLNTYNSLDKKNILNQNNKTEFQKKMNKLEFDDLLVAIGGPLSTTLIGSIGFLILIFRKKNNQIFHLTIIDWFLVFISMFWLRQVLNLFFPIIREIIYNNNKWFAGDEFMISQKLGIWPGTISIILGIIGLSITTYTTFKIVNKSKHLTFIMSGLIGCILGFILWMSIIGPKLLP